MRIGAPSVPRGTYVEAPASPTNGDTLRRVAGFWASLKRDVYDVREWGNNPGAGNMANDTAALRGMTEAIVAAGGGILRCPSPVQAYYVDTTAGPIFDIPANVPFSLEGAQMGRQSQKGTIFDRQAGGDPIFQAQGSVDPSLLSPTEVAYVSVRGVWFLARVGTGSPVVRLRKCHQTFFDHVTISGYINNAGILSGTGKGLHATQMLNSILRGVYFYRAGSGTADPACLFDFATGAPGTYSPTVTVHLIGCEWEGNLGTDLQIIGDSTNGYSSRDIHVSNFKMERQNPRGDGTENWPFLKVDLGQVQLSDGWITASNASMTSRLVEVVDNGANSDQNRVDLSNALLGVGSGVVITELVNLERGVLKASNVEVQGSPTTAFFRVGANARRDALRLRGVVPAIFGGGADVVTVPLVNDLRTNSLTAGVAGLGVSSPAVKTVESQWDGSGAVKSLVGGSSDVPVWVFRDAQSDKIFTTFRVPQDFRRIRTVRYTLASDVTSGNVRLTASLRALRRTDTLSAGLTATASITETVSASAGGFKAGDLALNPSSQPNAGDLITIVFTRLGADALDTCTGNVYLVVEPLYECYP